MAPFWDPVVYGKKVLGTGISLLGGPVGQHGVCSSTGEFERLLKGALEVGFSLYGSSVKGSLKRAPLLGILENR